jgi:colanic acid/amylovoran biosynthesis glycosyltransferase
MRIAYLTSEYPAISHTFIQREVEEMRRRGVAIDTFSVRASNPDGIITDAQRAEHEQTFVVLERPYTGLIVSTLVAVLRHPTRFARAFVAALRARTSGPSGLVKWMGYLVEGIRLGSELERRGIEHLHNHFANASANVAMLASAYTGIPFSFTLHGLPELDPPGVGRLADKLSRAAFMTTICHFNRAQALRMSDAADWGRVHVARCGIALEEFPHRIGERAAGPVRILSVARLSHEKGLPGLIEAFDQAVRGGLDAELILVGDGPERSLLEREVARRDLRERVHLRGRQAGPAVREAFAEADLFVLPSLMEGLPIVLMEAMATGTPVIAPRLAGIPELVVDGRTGLLFTPACWTDLAEQIGCLARDPELRARLARAGRKAVEMQHDIQKVVVPLLDLFDAHGSLSRTWAVPAGVEPEHAAAALPVRGRTPDSRRAVRRPIMDAWAKARRRRA